MPIDFRCTRCNRLLRTGDDTAGKQAKCPECGAIVAVPTAGAPPEVRSHPPAAGRQSPFEPTTPSAVSGEPVNPYQSPRGFGSTSAESAYQPYTSVHAYASARVAAPATGLLVTGSIGLALQVVGIVFNLLPLALPRNAPDAEILMLSGGISVLFGALGVVVAVVIIMGAWRMKSLQSYGLAMTGAIMAMAPCISPCCVLGLPFGIWAVVVLADPQVQAAFRTPQPH